MKGILFQQSVWQGKLRALKEYGEAETRRLIQLSDPDDWHIEHEVDDECPAIDIFCNIKTGERMGINPPNGKRPYDLMPRYHTGETVYVKEKYFATPWGDVIYPLLEGGCSITKWNTPMFMPERFARYFIKILEVRPERLQDINEQSALLEGMERPPDAGLRLVARERYAELWDSINKNNPWETNPWVFAYRFKLSSPKVTGEQEGG